MCTDIPPAAAEREQCSWSVLTHAEHRQLMILDKLMQRSQGCSVCATVLAQRRRFAFC
jgi:hypothetical protein